MQFSAALLVGGKSTRMGRDKAGLQMPDGKLLWQHQVETLIAAGASEILISGPTNGIYSGSDYRIIPDEIENCGPMSGLLSCLRQIHTSHLLLLAVDLPQMTSTYLINLWRKCSIGRGVVAKDKDYEPLAAFYPREGLSEIEQKVRAQDCGFQQWMNKMENEKRMTTVPIDDQSRQFFRNWNTPPR